MASKCPLCGEAEEDLNHLLIHCPLVWGLWERLISFPGLDWVCPLSHKDLMLEWTNFPIRKRVRKLWRAGPLCLFRAVLKERNRIVFYGTPFSVSRLKTKFLGLVLLRWSALLKEFFCAFSRVLFWVVGFLFWSLFCTSLVVLCLLPVYMDQPGSHFLCL